MIQENLFKTNIPTEPSDQNDLPRFGQLRETALDFFSAELIGFFSREASIYTDRLITVPTVRKYSLSYPTENDAPESSLTLIQNHPDILENLPAIAIGIIQGNQKKLGFNSNFVDHVQPGPRLVGTQDLTNPISVSENDQLVWETTPDGVNAQTSTIIINSSIVRNINSVTLRDLINAINMQSLYVVAMEYISNGQARLRLNPGKLGVHSPNKIEILSGSTPSFLSALGFSIGDSDDTDNPDRPPANRYQMAEDTQVVLDVLTEDMNQTREVSDLLKYFLTLELDDRDYTFYGRSIFNDDVVGEQFQIILKDNVTYSAYEIPRASGDSYDLLYGTRINVPVTIIDYIDRKVIDPSSFIKGENYQQAGPDVPLGDYADPDDPFGRIS